jgi:N-acetylmuramoyl-L-alanine amidase
VIYTRDKDIDVDLNKRGDLAMKSDADLFFSIHVNASDPKKPAPSGTETIVMSYDKATANLDVIKRENDDAKLEKDYEKKYAGFLSGSPESFAMSSFRQYANTDQSITLAQMIEKQFTKNTSMPSRGVKQGNVLVLWNITVPAILTEIGFINNDAERKFMTSKDGQKKIATSLFNAISEYKAKVEGNSNPVLLGSAGSYVPDYGTDPMLFPGGNAQGEPDKTSGTIRNTADKALNWESGGSSVVYRIQIHSVPRKLNHNGKELRPFLPDVTERRVGSAYKYYVGGCATYGEAAELQKEVRKTVKDAFMVAFDGEKQITVDEARKLTK